MLQKFWLITSILCISTHSLGNPYTQKQFDVYSQKIEDAINDANNNKLYNANKKGDRIVAVNIGAVFFLNLKRVVQSIGFTVGAANTIDGLIPAGTFWDDYAQNGNFDGPAINDVSASIAVRTTEDNPSSGSPTYTQFNTFANGTFKGRGFQFRTTLKSESVAHNISIQQLGITAAFESRTERSYVSGGSTSTAPLSSGTSSSGLDVTFAKPF